MSKFLDPSGRGPKGPALAIRGVAFFAILAVGVSLLLMKSQGTFEDKFAATALVADVGDGLPIGSDVKLRGVLVGRVSQVDSVPGQAEHVVQLDLKPQHAAGIPASVRARIIPTNIFGAPSVDLVPDPGDTRPLAEGATIQADTSAGTVKMQTAIDNLHKVLKSVQPAKLNIALHNISQALSGQGANIGDTIARLDRYLSRLNPHANELGESLGALADAMESLSKTAPDLLDVVDSVVTTTRTIVAKENQLVATLAGGADTSDTWRGFLEDTDDRLIRVLRSAKPVMSTMARQRDEIPRSFAALGRGVRGLISAFDPDTKKIYVAVAISGSPFQPYTAADCPRYPGLDGPNCGNAAPSQRTQAQSNPATQYGGTVGSVGSEQEQKQLTDILGLDGGGIGGLLGGPILRGTTAVMGR